MKTLPGQELHESDYADLLEAIDKLIWDMVYKPVVDLVRPSLPKPVRKEIAPRELRTATPKELHNSGEDALRKGLRDGVVQMVPDHTGHNALFRVVKPDRLISDGLKSFGAKLNKHTGLWAVAPSKVPAWVRSEAQAYATKARSIHGAVKKLVADISGKISEMVDAADLSKATGKSMTKVTKGWKEAAKRLEVGFDLGPEGQAALEAGFQRSRGIQIKSPGTKVGMVDAVDFSTKREVKVWAQEALARLRAEVEANAEQGYRAEGLAERIRNEYGVSKSRADLIARQETSNFMSNYRAARAADAGLKRYQWYAVRDARTRKDHKALHGKIFRYDSPPVTDTKTGARNNPGSDFRCRCIDRPVIE